MNYLILLATLLLFLSCFSAQITQIKHRNPRDVFLKRSKRFITFPEGSNFVLTISIVKAIMVKVPKGWNIILECDVPFKLPTTQDYVHLRTSKYHATHNHYRQRREIYNTLIDTLMLLGLDGTFCIESMKCEADYLKNVINRTLVEDLLVAILTYPKFSSYFLDESDKTKEFCTNALKKCKIPMLNFLLNPND